MTLVTKAAALLLAAIAVPALAQTAPPHQLRAGAGPDDGRGHRMMVKRFDHGGPGMGAGGMMGGTLAGLTPEGRKILGDAMRGARDGNRDAIGVARQKMLELLEADRLDVGALRRAMSEEHALAERQQQQNQDAMLSAFQKLSPRDRKAFAVSMRNQHYRMEQIRKDMDTRMSRMRDGWGKPGDMPPSPQSR